MLNTTATTAIAKALGPDGPLGKVSDLFHKLLGPLCEETGLLLGEKVHQFRLTNLKSVTEKAQQAFSERGTTPHAVPPRLAIPLLQNASLEEDEALQDMWAGLIATASEEPDTLPPSFIEILKQLSPYEAQTLQSIYGWTLPSKGIFPDPKRPLFEIDLRQIMSQFPDIDLDVAMEAFQRLGLVGREFFLQKQIDTSGMLRFLPSVPVSYQFLGFSNQDQDTNAPTLESLYYFTRTGISFMKACTGKDPGFAFKQ